MRARTVAGHSTVSLLQQRELGCSAQKPTHALAFERMAEDRAAHYELEETACQLPPSVRSTFLMVFSPDCTRVASTHGDHRIHVCEVSSGRLAHTLEGHPRTPWCLAFHPTCNHILASGCLAGQVRVWDLRGGSEVWRSREGTVISSLAFHPLEPLLAIATANRVVLWHWRRGAALATCKTASQREKVRFVQFCSGPRGDSLVTGITNVEGGPSASPRVLDPLLGPQVGALRVPAADVGGSSQRRSILTRLMAMYQHLEGLEEVSVESRQQPQPMASPGVDEALQQAREYARDVTRFSQRLHNLQQQQQQQRGGGSGGWAEEGSSAEDEEGPAPRVGSGRHFWATFYRLRSICSRLERRIQQHHQLSSAATAGPSTSRGGDSQQSLSLVSLLSRLQTSLQSLSSAALTTAVARDQIHQVRLRITEILERLSNVSGYRARLTSIRDQIYEAAAAGPPWPGPPWQQEPPQQGVVVQHWDLAYCLWLVEMSLQLTRQMQRILAADYRLTQLHLSASSSPPASASASAGPPWLGRRPGGEESSSDSLDSSDEESLSFGRSLSRSRVQRLAAGRFWVASPPPPAGDHQPAPEAATLRQRRRRPPAPAPSSRARSPPLPPVILSGPSSRPPPPDPWSAPAYVSAPYEGSFRPRLSSVYEAGPNLTHRIQCWDITGSQLPDIGDAQACVVAPRCKIHNDSSVALCGELLAALVPCGLLGASLCVYGLHQRPPQLLHTWSFGANAISVSLSPLARYLVVGFASTRHHHQGYFAPPPPHDREVVAQIFKLSPADSDGPSSSSCPRGQLQQVGNLSQPGPPQQQQGGGGGAPVSLNSVRWLPRPGEGLIYGTNRGSLCICRPLRPICRAGEEEEGAPPPSSHGGPTRDATSPFVMLTDQVDRAARDTTIRVLSTASQTAGPRTQTTGTQTTLRGSAILVGQPRTREEYEAAGWFVSS
ncbi:activating molecule in BECN1-regulated autophagy protein 1-like isoform X1 [Haemaphysalis longicornis]